MTVALSFAGLAAIPSVAHAQSKVAVVDLRRAVLETEEGLRVQATLKKLFDSRQVELDNKQRGLQEEKDKLDKDLQGGKVAKDAYQRKYENLQKEAAELQATVIDYQKEMQRKESELTTPIVQRVMGLVRRIASQEGYEVVIDKQAAPYFRADLEVTDKAIQMYNSGQAGETAPAEKGTNTAPSPKAPAPKATEKAQPAPKK